MSLIYDNSGGYSDLATLNFGTQKISYQRAFPIIVNLQSVIFTSPTVYYAGYYDNYFFTEQTTSFRDLGLYHIS